MREGSHTKGLAGTQAGTLPSTVFNSPNAVTDCLCWSLLNVKRTISSHVKCIVRQLLNGGFEAVQRSKHLGLSVIQLAQPTETLSKYIDAEK